MVPVASLSPALLADLVRRQPLTRAKLAFCWRLVVGPAVDRATRVHLNERSELVVSADAAWKRELERMRPELTRRLQALLGTDVKRLVFSRGNAPASTSPARRRPPNGDLLNEGGAEPLQKPRRLGPARLPRRSRRKS